MQRLQIKHLSSKVTKLTAQSYKMSKFAINQPLRINMQGQLENLPETSNFHLQKE